MAKIELELDDTLLERVRHLAEARHSTVDRFIADSLDQTISLADADPLLGMFAEEPELIDQLLDSAMEAREKHPLRQKHG